jgi:hypothetical protein
VFLLLPAHSPKVHTMASSATFVCCDFVERDAGGGARSRCGGWTDCIAGSFDAVLCLSTSKWMHLNHGDEGIKRLFSRVFTALKPGG